MLNIQKCLYGLWYGGSEENGPGNKENVGVALLNNHTAQVAATCATKMRDDLIMDDGWVYVEEAADVASGRSSPVMVQNYDLEDCSSTASSENSKMAATPMSKSRIQQIEALHRAKFMAAKKAQLEQKLFEDSTWSGKANGKEDDAKAKAALNQNHCSASKLKRSTVAGYVAAENKIKQRSKKSGKLFAGRNNDRKCNNVN